MTPDSETPFAASFTCPDCRTVLSDVYLPCPVCGLIPAKFKGHLSEKRSRRYLSVLEILGLLILTLPLIPIIPLLIALASALPGNSNLEPLRYIRSAEHRRSVHDWWRRKGAFQVVVDVGSHIVFAIGVLLVVLAYVAALYGAYHLIRYHTIPPRLKALLKTLP